MAHASTNTAWVPISHEMRETLGEYGAGAIVRLREFGFQDRREAAFKTLLAGAAPMGGMLVLGWEPLAALTSLLLNVLLLEAEDIWKFVRAGRPWAEVKRECVQDQFVWPVAVQMAHGGKTVYGKFLPRVEDVQAGKVDNSWWLGLSLSVLIVGFVLFMLQGSGAVYGQGRNVAFGSMPSLVAALVLAIIHGYRRDPHASRAASVRLQSVSTNSLLVFGLMFPPFIAVTTPREAGDTGEGLAVLCGLAVLLYGFYRLYKVGQMERAAKWLQRWLARAERLRVAKSQLLPAT